MLFSPNTSRQLLACFTRAISGTALYQKASFLQDALGQQIFPDYVTITDDPSIMGGLGSRYADNDGVVTQRRQLVEAGQLKGYLLGTYSARQLGMTSTGNAGGHHNIICAGSGGDISAMLDQLGTGLYVTDFIGRGVDLTTGDLSKGIVGFWVEKGRIQFPVNAMTVAGNLRDIFMGVRSISSTLDRRSSIHTGAWLVDGLMVAGQ